MSVYTHQGEDYTINDPNIAPEFDSTLANAKGDYVNYQGDLYRFDAAHTANTTWANRSKTKIKLGAELLAEITKRQKITDKLDYVTPKNLFDKDHVIFDKYYQGGNSTPTLVDNSEFCCYLAEVEGGQTYIINYKDYQIDAFDKNQNLIGEEYFVAGVARQIASNAKYLSISVKKTHLVAFMLICGSSVPAGYVRYGVGFENDFTRTYLQNEMDTLIATNNLFDKNNVTNNKYYQGGNEHPTKQNNSSFCCYLAEIYDDKAQYICTCKDYQMDAFDENKNLIHEVYPVAEKPFNVPEGTRYLTVSLYKSNADSYMLLKGNTYPDEYIPFGTVLKNSDYVKHSEISPSGEATYHVGTNQTYTELLPLLRTLANNSSPKTIYIHEGEYDIFDEYGGQTYMESLTGSETWSEVSVFVPPNTKIIGLGNVVLKFEPTDTQIVSGTNASLFSILNVKHECHIENLTLKGKNCRYCIHDETSGVTNKGVHHSFKNVICKMSHGSYGNSQCYGAGYTEPIIYDFDECTFDSWGIPFSIHNGDMNASAESSTINIRGCIFSGNTDVAISFRNNTYIQHHDIVNIVNSYIGGQDKKVELTMSNSAYRNNFDVAIIGCNRIVAKDDSTVTNPYTIRQYNSIVTA